MLKQPRMTPAQAVRKLRTQPDTPGATDLDAMRNRVIAMDWLYRLSGRNDPNHSLHGTYSGLWQESPF